MYVYECGTRIIIIIIIMAMVEKGQKTKHVYCCAAFNDIPCAGVCVYGNVYFKLRTRNLCRVNTMD